MVGNLSHGSITFLSRCTEQEFLENRRLKDFDQLKLPSAFNLDPFSSASDEPSSLNTAYHFSTVCLPPGFIRPIKFEENGVLAVDDVFSSVWVKVVVLMAGELVVMDNCSAGKTNNPSHLHRMPSGTFSHNIAIERVENALVSELE